VSLFCIIIVFAPMLLLSGVAAICSAAREAVVFAMIASYILTIRWSKPWRAIS